MAIQKAKQQEVESQGQISDKNIEKAKDEDSSEIKAKLIEEGKQTVPPTIPVKNFYPNNIFPEGEWQSYHET